MPEPYVGSPFIAEATSKMLQAVIDESDRIQNRRRAAGWRRWAQWSNRTAEPPMVIHHGASSAHWDEWTHTERVFFLKTCAAPFVLSDENVAELLAAIDAERHRPATG